LVIGDWTIRFQQKLRDLMTGGRKVNKNERGGYCWRWSKRWGVSPYSPIRNDDKSVSGMCRASTEMQCFAPNTNQCEKHVNKPYKPDVIINILTCVWLQSFSPSTILTHNTLRLGSTKGWIENIKRNRLKVIDRARALILEICCGNALLHGDKDINVWWCTFSNSTHQNTLQRQVLQNV